MLKQYVEDVGQLSIDSRHSLISGKQKSKPKGVYIYERTNHIMFGSYLSSYVIYFFFSFSFVIYLTYIYNRVASHREIYLRTVVNCFVILKKHVIVCYKT